MQNKLFRYFILGLSLILSACSAVDVSDYAATEPRLDLKTFFNGDLKVYGMVQDMSGKMTRRFSADIKASWQGNTGTLDEVFYFDDGEQQTRIWTLNDLGNGRYTGTAGDVVGVAQGQTRGAVFRWQYELTIPYDGDTLNVHLDDWLYLISEDRLLNRTSINKFGIEVGEITLIIEKRN
ncbi:DUF3833 domain-containing protein [Planctobacterium marinum]|uniref:DUF3833 domain-containing protein n=1 Tax=Planctobacterium marinum TaxID=1631968 RepID=UPI001E60A674|nr:DUF3833 domain-containing protein [Planctobacterium marinum]MCC2606998.1 DUF3833 domain-containing protein [Planctobacterium marinum]